ncbi:LppU/SCO3897 family protein [Streptomyces sp. NPDC001219]
MKGSARTNPPSCAGRWWSSRPPVRRPHGTAECSRRGPQAPGTPLTIACSDTKADYKVMFSATAQGKCPQEFDEYTERGGRNGDTTLCMTRVRH